MQCKNSFLQNRDSLDTNTVDLVCTTDSSGSCARFLASSQLASITSSFVSVNSVPIIVNSS